MSIDVVEDAAVAVLAEDDYLGVDYVNFFSLIKINGTWKIVTKLFDLMVDSAAVYILHPSGFEFAGKLQSAILEAVPTNIKRIQTDLPFVALRSIEESAVADPRAARLLASIHGQKQSKNINKENLVELCKRTSVDVTEADGVLTVAAGHEVGFLELLDRRRYELELVAGQPEQFKAGSRTRIPQGS
jgi:hypothetical protein